ncbi:hypothetical protein H8E07_17090, partial [bacterium]|nr:hypothetical protein [bacterium]
MNTKRIPRQIKWIPVLALLVLNLTCVCGLAGETKLKVGVYDSRVVALVYGQSDETRQRFRQLHADHRAAEAAGDTAKVRELETQGPWLQERL